MTRPRLTCAAEIAHVIAHGPGALSPEMRPAVRLHLDHLVTALEGTIADHTHAGAPLSADSPEVNALRRARHALDTLATETP